MKYQWKKDIDICPNCGDSLVGFGGKSVCANCACKEIDRLAPLEQSAKVLSEMNNKLQSALTTAQEENKRYKDALEFNPLAEKMSLKKKQFIVVAIDEPYFKEVYDIIRKEERRKDTWNFDDEMAYVEALKINQSALNGGK